MEYMTFDEFKTLPEYKTFAQEYPDTGILKVNVFTAGGAIPLSNTNVLILKQIGNYNVLFFNGITNSMGIIDNIVLPTPRRVANNTDLPSYTFYELSAIHIGYQDIKQYRISMFGNTKVIQYVRLTPEVKTSV